MDNQRMSRIRERLAKWDVGVSTTYFQAMLRVNSEHTLEHIRFIWMAPGHVAHVETVKHLPGIMTIRVTVWPLSKIQVGGVLVDSPRICHQCQHLFPDDHTGHNLDPGTWFCSSACYGVYCSKMNNRPYEGPSF